MKFGWHDLLAAGAAEAGATLTRDDCRAILDAVEHAQESARRAHQEKGEQRTAYELARADAAAMQTRLLTAEEELDQERRRMVDAVVADAEVVCAWCSAVLPSNAQAIHDHAASCSHHPHGQQRALLAAATSALEHFAAVFDRLTHQVVCYEGDAKAARLRDMVRGVFRRDPTAVAEAVRGVVADAVAAEGARWRRAIEAHGLHTLPAADCFNRVIEWMEQNPAVQP